MDATELFAIDDIAFCTQLVRDNARDLYLANLLLPETARAKALIIHALHVEITNITLGHGDPLASEVRLQWWSEVISKKRSEEGGGHPVARSLLLLIENEPLVAPALLAKIEAHIFDLYQDPMPDHTTLEGWCGETRSSLFQLVAQFCGAESNSKLADASGHAGCCMAMIGVLENMSLLRDKGQNYIPADLLNSVGLQPSEFLAVPDERHAFAVSGMVDLAREHQMKAKTAIGELDEKSRSVFKTLALADLYLKRFEKDPKRVFAQQQPISALRIQWALWRG